MHVIENSLRSVGLALACLAAGSAVAAQEGRLAALQARLDAARADLSAAEQARMQAYSEAGTDQDRAKALAGNPWEALRGRFETLAYDADGTEVAAGAWATIYVSESRYGEDDRAWEAFNVLVNDHPDSEELNDVVPVAMYATSNTKTAVAGLKLLVETSSTESVVANSLFGLGLLLGNDEATREESLDCYRKVVAEHADVKTNGGKSLGERATAALFEAEHLRIGSPVPDYEALDETGAPFKLSDYEGKVVLLDFWGFW